ncbi:hypothetical protein FDECE_1540 [Fusarium decemcellulare]|nr:hypothetical protein FDECE_1540 [Fusarium decemcellulare]
MSSQQDSIEGIDLPLQTAEKGGSLAQLKSGGAARFNTASSQDVPKKVDDEPKLQESPDDSDEDDRKAYVARYNNNVPFPFETGEIVWILKPGYRAPLGEFRIQKAHPDDMFELVSCATNATHPELVEGKHLRRNV